MAKRYGTRDQDCNGVIDSRQGYPAPVVSSDTARPGCGPFEIFGPRDLEYPYAYINTKLDSPVACSEEDPCFCYTEPL